MSEDAEMNDVVTMEKIVSLCRRRGFVFPSSEIYGGLGSSYDYGHYGVLAKNNVKARWLEAMTQERDDIVALDSTIILHPGVWEASGHVQSFSDPLVDCKTCKKRFRADDLEHCECGKKPSKHPGDSSDCELTEPRQFNLMFETTIGPVQESGSKVYLRPETAQGIFINFKNVLQLARRKPPFGIAQIGKSFRNEITPGNFLFRTREFEQMELEFFV
ncbi:MAG: glycine--tRNA ligase, partial [Gaiellaceae bacterium]